MELNTLPQPPPDVPAPPPGPEALASRRKAIRIFVLLPLLMLLILAVVAPWIYRKRHSPGVSAVVFNLKQVHLALLDFDSDYGRFPDATTIPAVKSATSTSLPLGAGSSNELLRQLIAGTVKSESMFWAKTTQSPKKGDGDISGPKALAKGECGFTYVAGLSSSSDPDTPVLMTPAIPGTWKFDRKAQGGKAAILFVDESVQLLPIDKNGDVIINGLSIFDPRQPYWKGKAPDIKWPE